MRKLILLLVLCSTLIGSAGAELTREQKVARVTQAVDVIQKGGQVLQGRIEVPDGVGTLYVQYPGKLFIDYERGKDVRVVDGKLTWDNGNTEAFNADPLWVLVSGSLGKSVEIQMVDMGPDPFYGSSSGVLVADLVTTDERAPKLRLRIYVSADGTPRLLGWGHREPLWLRDLHPIAPSRDVFGVPKL